MSALVRFEAMKNAGGGHSMSSTAFASPKYCRNFETGKRSAYGKAKLFLVIGAQKEVVSENPIKQVSKFKVLSASGEKIRNELSRKVQNSVSKVSEKFVQTVELANSVIPLPRSNSSIVGALAAASISIVALVLAIGNWRKGRDTEAQPKDDTAHGPVVISSTLSIELSEIVEELEEVIPRAEPGLKEELAGRSPVPISTEDSIHKAPLVAAGDEAQETGLTDEPAEGPPAPISSEDFVHVSPLVTAVDNGSIAEILEEGAAEVEQLAAVTLDAAEADSTEDEPITANEELVCEESLREEQLETLPEPVPAVAAFPGTSVASNVAEEVLAAVLEERLSEVECSHREELEAVRAMADAENSFLRGEVEKKAKLEEEIDSLKHNLSVVKELTEFLLDGNRKEVAMEVEKLGAKLDGEIRLRREMEDRLLSQEKQLQSLQELLAVVEKERDSLTIELRDSLAAYKELQDRCEDLSLKLETSRTELERNKEEWSETARRKSGQELLEESMELADAEELVSEKMEALGIKELEFEYIQREVERTKQKKDTLNGNGSTLAAEMAEMDPRLLHIESREEALRKAEKEFESRQVEAFEEVTWLRNLAGDAVLLEDEIKRIKKQLQAAKEASRSQFFKVLLGESTKGGEVQEEVETKGARDVEMGEFYRAKLAELRWRLADSQVKKVRAEREHWEEMQAMKRRLSTASGKNVDARLLDAQNEIERLRDQVQEKESDMQEFRRQAEAALAVRDSRIEALTKHSHLPAMKLDVKLPVSLEVVEAEAMETAEKASGVEHVLLVQSS